jgi:hypothetical protein
MRLTPAAGPTRWGCGSPDTFVSRETETGIESLDINTVMSKDGVMLTRKIHITLYYF